MFFVERDRTLAGLAALGDSICCYIGGEWVNRRCDCKYGIIEGGPRGEHTGCPEVRSAYKLIEAMDDREWAMWAHRAGGLLPDDIGEIAS